MSSFQAPAYQIERTSGQCAVTGRTLQPGESYIATLIEVGDGLQRIDVSEEAWAAGQRPEAVFSYWKTTIPQPTESKRVFVDDAVLMNLLRRLGEDDSALSEQRVAFRFVLALILMRKKLLRYDRTEQREATHPRPRNGAGEQVDEVTPDEAADPATTPEAAESEMQTVTQTWWLMTPKLDISKGPLGKWADETIAVRDPQLDEDGIRAVTEQLGEILNAELQ